jgi:NAD(P)H-dependent FMN reductase
MLKTLIVVGLGGSLAENSKSRAALQVALEGAADAGAETQLLDLSRLDLPLYNPDDDEPTETAATLIEAAYAANGLLWSSPLYQGTISGAFKNALDWLHTLGAREPPYLHDKVIGSVRPVERKAFRRSTRWSSRCGRFEPGRSRTSFQSQVRRASSTARGWFVTRRSSGS